MTVIGLIQGGVQYACYGKPKPIAADAWDRLMERRDTAIRNLEKARR